MAGIAGHHGPISMDTVVLLVPFAPLEIPPFVPPDLPPVELLFPVPDDRLELVPGFFLDELLPLKLPLLDAPEPLLPLEPPDVLPPVELPELTPKFPDEPADEAPAEPAEEPPPPRAAGTEITSRANSKMNSAVRNPKDKIFMVLSANAISNMERCGLGDSTIKLFKG